MTFQTVALVIVSISYFIIKYLNHTDIPKIKGLPEIPGIPIFGNLFQLGENHARVAREWANKYGPVFQIRMGNRVCQSPPSPMAMLTVTSGLFLQIHSSL